MGGRRHRKRNEKNTMKGGNMYGVGKPITAGALEYTAITNNGGMDASQIGASDINLMGGRRRGTRRRGMTAKAMKRVLKKNGLKVSGKKSTLTKRMKKAKLMKGGAAELLPMKAVSGFTGVGAVAGLGGYQDVGGAKPNGVVPLSG